MIAGRLRLRVNERQVLAGGTVKIACIDGRGCGITVSVKSERATELHKLCEGDAVWITMERQIAAKESIG